MLFIVFLKALAAVLITNAHYIGVYPTDWLAHGGMIGNIIFFAVSGYCLYNIKSNFVLWYAKRFTRVYFPMFIITIAYIFVGYFEVTDEQNLIYWFVYPTFYHFVLSILICYVPYYIIMRIQKLKNNLLPVMFFIAAVFAVVYIFVFDRSYYHIDDINYPMVRFMFLESMLLGAWFRQNDEKIRNNGKGAIKFFVLSALMCVVFFASKLIFSRISQASDFQFINQLVLMFFLYCVFRFFAAMDSKFHKFPTPIVKIVKFISNLTLEIYLVQHMLIEYLDLPNRFSFPINFIVLTSAIIALAFVLHLVTKPFINLVNRGLLKAESVLEKRKSEKNLAL